MSDLKPCPRCGWPEGLIRCERCHATMFHDPAVRMCANVGPLRPEPGMEGVHHVCALPRGHIGMHLDEAERW